MVFCCRCACFISGVAILLLTPRSFCLAQPPPGAVERIVRIGPTGYGVPCGRCLAPQGPPRWPYWGGGYASPGYAPRPQAYPWGYFGARWRTTKVTHRGYYGDFVQWGYRRGY